jgi:hypothetical protein
VNTDAVGVGVGVLVLVGVTVGVTVLVGVTVGVFVMVGVIVGVADGDTLTQGVLLLIHVAQSTHGPTIISI